MNYGRSMFFIVLAQFWAFACNANSVAMNKCKHPDGQIEFTDRPCSANTSSLAIVNKELSQPPRQKSQPIRVDARSGMPLVSGTAENSCAIKSASSNEVSTVNLHSLFSQIISACNSKQSDNFFALQTTSIREKLIAPLPTEQKKELFNQYCTFTNDANRAIGGRPENGVHSIQLDDRKTMECGQRVSYWYIHTSQGQLVYRLQLAIENGQLKIHDH